MEWLNENAQEIIHRYLASYLQLWRDYGILFALYITIALFLEKPPSYFVATESDQILYSGVIFTFLLVSIIVKLFKTEKILAECNSADVVSWYLGTKKPPSVYARAGQWIFTFWVLLFFLVIGADLLVTFDQLINANVSSLMIILNLLFVVQFVWAVLKIKRQ